ncbi:hypothetical protein [Novosphingobium sp. FSW06-99]|uniref:hypothetical protein n=1 Tax=Novosphingobium sp. FSW06-99 TaxID=1739113 RepID=UPI00076CC87A|nr:hypothetical protein AQZ49_09770 [Novosphingobium sp. FSW06-99]
MIGRRAIDWIWHVRGSLDIGPTQSAEDAFNRLSPLFRQAGTSHECSNNTLIFRKKNQAAQDRMAVFDGGILQIDTSMSGPVLHYDLNSRALLFCFLAPLLFLAIAQLTILTGKFDTTPAAQAIKQPAPKKPGIPMNAIDKALGAPAPDTSGKDAAQDKKPSPTPGYVFAGIFAALYVIGRWLEARLVRALFRAHLLVS